MKNPTKSIKSAISTALSSLTYTSVSVPVYTDEPLVIVPDYFVKVGDINVVPDNQNNAKFTSSASVVVDVITIITGTYDSTACDAISETVINTITPNPGVCSLTSVDFQFINCWVDSMGYLNGTQGDRKVVRKILTFTFKIEQI